MPIVAAICTQCGAGLQVDNSLDAAICPFCNVAFIVEKAINNYNTTNYVNNNISNSVVNIMNGGNDIEHLLQNVNTFMKIRKYNEAEKLLKDITMQFPEDYRGWLYTARLKENLVINLVDNENYKIALTLANENGIEDILSKEEKEELDIALKVRCPYCGAIINENDIYCDECGIRLCPY